MKNAETPVVKVVLYGAMSSLGSAPRPSLRTMTDEQFKAEPVKQSEAWLTIKD